jgi:hypothetical protein
MGMFKGTMSNLVATMAENDITAITDPRQARPGVVFLEMPAFDGFSNNIADMTVTLRFLAPGPGNQISSDACLDMADKLLDTFAGAITTGRATSAIIGDQVLPAYDFTLRVVTRREQETD